jgi:hypothetical protein
MAVLSSLFIIFAILILVTRDIKDEFIRRAMIFLVIACLFRLITSFAAAYQDPNSYASNENVPL